MKKLKIILPVAALCVILAVFLTVNLTMSYLTDYEVKRNIVTIGKVSVELDEGDYEDSTTVPAGGTLPKAPSLKNTGNKDEFVFLRISVPKKEVTLLYEENTTVDGTEYKRGTPTVNNYDQSGNIIKKKDEIFKMLAKGIENGAEKANAAVTGYPDTSPQIVFEFNEGDSTQGSEVEGWRFLKRVTDDEDYNHYYFGYNKRLTYVKNDPQKTVTLFDEIQLKSFIDEELMDTHSSPDEEVTVQVKAYGIQADSLGIPDIDDEAAFLDDSQLNRVFGIIERKQVA